MLNAQLKPVVGQQQQQLSVAARNAEALFEAKNVAEIRQIEARTRQDIEEKNLQLRQLVGDSYRDLIDGTDKIIDISTKCHSILDSILAVQEGCARLAVSVSATPGSAGDGKESVRKHRELNAVGSRVKYVMDTPEVIWGCLEAGSHLEAARRLLRVQEVNTHLQTGFAAVVAAKFPVLSHQWQTVLKFRQHILSGALTALNAQQGLSSRAAADALAAVALLEGYDSSAALKCFLSARQHWVQQQLEQAAQGQAGQGDTPGDVLADLAQTVQSCVAQVGELFTAQQQQQQQEAAALSSVNQPDPTSNADALNNQNSSSSSLLQQVLREDEADVSELFFGSAEGPAGGSASPEAAQWRQRSETFSQQLAPLQQAQVQEACTAWLSEVSDSCRQHGLSLLQQCPDAHTLLAAEAAVHTAMAEWAAAPADDEAPDSTSAQPQQDGASTAAAAAGGAGGSRPATAGSGGDGGGAGGVYQEDRRGASRLSRLAPAAASAAASPPGSPAAKARGRGGVSQWEVTCTAVLGHKVDLWQVLFHNPFLERCKQIIAAALAEACSSIQEPLAAAMEAAAQHQPEPAGQLQPGVWPSVQSVATAADGSAVGGMVGSLERSGSLWGAQGSSLSHANSRTLSLNPNSQVKDDQGAAAFRAEVHTLLQLFNSQLHAALSAVLLLTAAPAAAAGGRQQQHKQHGRISSPLHPTSSNASLLRGLSGATPRPSSSGSPMAAAGAAAAPASPSSAAAAAAVAASGRQRASELEAFAQQHCLQEVQQLAAHLQQQLAALPTPPPGVQGAAIVEQVLLLARLCSVLGSQSCMLPAVLGAPDAWAAAAAAGPHVGPVGSGSGSSHSSSLPASLAQGVSALGPAAAALLRMHHPGLSAQAAGGAALSGAAALLLPLQQELHGIACSGYAAWASWVGRSLAAEVAAVLARDELLYSDRTPLAWTETKLSTEAAGADAAAAELLDLLDDAGAAAGGDMCFALPACPSAAVLQVLSRACWEVRRAGEHTTPADALQLLLWELHGSLLATLQQLLQTSSTSSSHAHSIASNGNLAGAAAGHAGSHRGVLTEKGVLQLLFDQRFMRDVLGGGKPLAAVSTGSSTQSAAVANGGSAAATDVAARKKLVSGIEQQLQDLLDPIDWATYEPHLWSNAQRFYSRTAVLLGVLGQLSKPYGDAPRTAPGAAAADINALNVLPVVPRFHYLPISTPSTASLPKQRSMHLSMHASAAVTAIARAAGAPVGHAVGGAAAVAAAGLPGGARQTQLLPLATISAQASDLAAQYMITDLGSSGSSARAAAAAAGVGDGGYSAGGAAAAAAAAAASFLHPTADTAAAAGASALSALQAKLQGSSFGAFGSMLGDRAAEVTAMAQNFGDLLPTAGGLGGGLGGFSGGLLSSFARRDGVGGGGGGAGGGR